MQKASNRWRPWSNQRKSFIDVQQHTTDRTTAFYSGFSSNGTNSDIDTETDDAHGPYRLRATSSRIRSTNGQYAEQFFQLSKSISRFFARFFRFMQTTQAKFDIPRCNHIRLGEKTPNNKVIILVIFTFRERVLFFRFYSICLIFRCFDLLLDRLCHLFIACFSLSLSLFIRREAFSYSDHYSM